MKSRLLTVGSLAILLSLLTPMAAAEDEPVGVPIPGARVPESSLGVGFIEGMDAVLARDAEQRERGPNRPKARNGKPGVWYVPRPGGTFFTRGKHNVVNKWGDTRMGIGFPEPVSLEGTWVAGQGAGAGVWAGGLRVIGYRDGVEIGRTAWFREIDETPSWFAIDLDGVDRIEFEAIPVHQGAGWFALDDIAYTPQGGPQVVLDFEDAGGLKLTGGGYRGLTWESGTGDFNVGREVHPPVESPDDTGVPGGATNGTDGGIAGGGAALPILADQFQGVLRGDAGQFSYPPDTCGAVGPDHFVEVVNVNFSVYIKNSGLRVMNTSLGSFLPGSGGDPRVLFDQDSGRWIVISTNFNNRFYIAVSLTDDPTGSWFKTDFIASEDSDAGCWPDYPTLGVDPDGIYISAFMVGCGRSVWAIEKAPLLDGSPSLGTITAWRGLTGGTIQGVHHYGTPPGGFFIGRLNNTTMRMRRVDPPLTAPTITNIDVGVPNNFGPADIASMGSATPLDSVDARVMNAVYRDGSIWCAHHVDVAGRAAARWYEISETGSLIQTGAVSDPTLEYFFPAIAVNGAGDAVMAFSGTSSGQFAGAYYTGRLGTDAPGQMAPPLQYRAGNSTYNLIDGFGRNRWGDYSLTSLDPTDESIFWTVQEYAHANTTWGTQIAKFQGFGPPPPANFDCSGAITVENEVVAFSTISAPTTGFPDNLCSVNGDNQISKDIWYRYDAVCDGDVTVSLCGSDFDTKLAIYEIFCPTVPNLAIACNDDFCGAQSELTFTATDNRTYYIRAGGRLGEEGTGTMTITAAPCIPAPNNDSCSSASPLTVGNTPFTTIGATTSGPSEIDCDVADDAQVDRDIWYRVNNVCEGTLTIGVCDATFDTKLAVYGGTCPTDSGTVIACNDNGCGLQSQVSFAASPGIYRVRVGSADDTTGTGTLTVACDAGPACPEDVNGDNVVNVDDLVEIIVNWGPCPSCAADVNNDNVVDVNDLVGVITAWGDCP